METFLAVYNTAYHGIVSMKMKRKATTLDRFFGLFNKPKNTESDSEPKLSSLRTCHEDDC
ncbi:hypothetical protein DPMN_174304 [Dreissena polymorpha]|uniref:Uncharacterized protein n=1 Tax=Dreissena polymorpha TaxID=45954 RepID=A0A9D4IHR3_DREPO|nr:hypothetical protein DPMN_174304 [Dreissena polymorpha]